MGVDNRLSAKQLAALAPGDPVTIECAGDFRRPRYVAGTVVRITGTRVVVCIRSPKGVTYQEQYRRRDGIREGGGLTRGELVNAPSSVDDGAQRRTQQIDPLYRTWARNRSDVEALRRLQDAISECLLEEQAADIAASRVVTPADTSR